jgi:hypothetical protein
MKTYLFLCCALVLSCRSWSAPVADARDLAMGGIIVSSVSPELALFLNPAILSASENFKTVFSQARLSADQFDYEVSSSIPILKNQIGVGIGWDALVSQNQLETGIVRDSNGQVIVNPSNGLPLTQVLGFFTRNDNTVYCSMGAKFGFYSLGISLKGFLTDFGGLQGYGLGIDAGCRAQLNPDLYIGGVLYDIGNSILDFQGNAPNEKTSNSWTMSLAWKTLNNKEIMILVEPGISETYLQPSTLNWGGGIEASWMRDFFLRGGVNQDRLSFGIGLVTHPLKVFPEIKMDYAYLGGDENDYPSRLTLTVEW